MIIHFLCFIQTSLLRISYPCAFGQVPQLLVPCRFRDFPARLLIGICSAIVIPRDLTGNAAFCSAFLTAQLQQLMYSRFDSVQFQRSQQDFHFRKDLLAFLMEKIRDDEDP